MKLPFNVDLKNKVAVVTGGSGILCGAMAEALAACGAKVAILALGQEGCDAKADQIKAAGGTAIGINTNVLDNINLKINSGETIGFVGQSGEGKTTLIRLILSLITPSSGTITLRENDINKKLNPIHRNLISYVPQGNTLFSGTIEDNLKYGNPNATEKDIIEALKNACALDFVDKLDDGIKAIIGEKGVGISEGQAQRLSIARAFLRERPILILDEATSSLDPETEIKVLKSISSLSNKPTCIIITHRPSALNICNRILKLHSGKLSEINKNEMLEVASELV